MIWQWAFSISVIAAVLFYLLCPYKSGIIGPEARALSWLLDWTFLGSVITGVICLIWWM